MSIWTKPDTSEQSDDKIRRVILCSGKVYYDLLDAREAEGKDDIYKKTAVLSGGEKSRLNLVKFLVDPPNLLLMDEPTTHLDIHTVESLTLALERYEGTLVFISHDVHFIRKLATKVLHVNAGTVSPYPGGYDYFLEKTNALDDERAALTAG